MINFDTPVELRRCSVSLVNKPFVEVLPVGDGDFFFVKLESILIWRGSTIGFIFDSSTFDTGECCWLFDGDSRGDIRLFVVKGGDERFFDMSWPLVVGLCCWDVGGDERLTAVVVEVES